MSAQAKEPENALLKSTRQQSVGDYIQGYLQRVRSGDIGSLPIIFGMIVIAVIFQTANENFLTPRNLVNLIVQMAAITTIGYGIVYVLLLGEIDLSVGFVSGTAAVSMTLALRGPLVNEMAVGIGIFFALAVTYFIWHLLLVKVHNPALDFHIPLVAVLGVFIPVLIGLGVYINSTVRPITLPDVILLVIAAGVVGVVFRKGITLRLLAAMIIFLIITVLVAAVLTGAAQPWYIAVPVALVAAAGIGLLHGTIITYFGLPSFVVTLAGLLAWQGVVLIFIGGAGTVILQDSTVLGVARAFLPAEVGWLVMLVFVAAFAANEFRQMQQRKSRGLAAKPIGILVLQTLLLGSLAAVAVWICNQDRGVPAIGVGLILMMIGLSFLATRTRFGRYVFAVGGNAEAARRAGISVQQIRVRVFMISSFMAGVGGIILAARLSSVDTNAGGGQILLNSIAAAVIGGTSLFGGSGKVSSAMLGAVIIAGVDNGMGLLGLSAGVKFIITALVLLAAVVVDALARRSQKQSGIR
ncbi:MAG: ABC transporter permease [Anaerolineae bacterium]|nr:ABC transporter permease [Anaerolineae bacterium]